MWRECIGLIIVAIIMGLLYWRYETLLDAADFNPAWDGNWAMPYPGKDNNNYSVAFFSINPASIWARRPVIMD